MVATTSARVAPGRSVVRIAAAAFIATALVVVAAGLFMAYNAAAHWTHPHREAASTTPAAYGLQYEDLRLVTEDNLRLAAWYVPSTSGAAIVMLHGLGGNRGDDLALAADLSSRGYALLIPDLRAHGESEGAASTLSLHEVRDVRAAVNYIEHRPDVDPDRIAVYGASLGAATAIMAASEMPELRAVVADSSFSSIEWVVEHQFKQLESVPQWLAPVVVAIGSWQMGAGAKDIAPVARIGRISPRPVMILHGDLDGTFAVENAELLGNAALEPKELWIYPGVGHTGAYAADPEAYVERVAGFFDRWLILDGSSPASWIGRDVIS